MPRFILIIITLYMSLSLLVGTLAFTSPFIRSRHDVSFCNAKDNIRRCCVESQSDETPESSYVPTTTTTRTSFTSPTYKVYIEDTDSYGVMYNGNYLRAYERALSNLFRSSSSSDGTSYDRHRRIITHVTNQKFRSSPALGEEFVIRGDLIVDADKDGDNNVNIAQTWRLQMVTKNNKSDDDDADDDDDWIVHNSAQLTLSRPTSSVVGISSYSSTSTSSKKMRVEEIHRAYYDELDSHYYPVTDEYEYHVPLRSAMNYFERSRTNVLGGPDKLARMQNEDDILWVVTSVDNGELMFDSIVVVGEETDLNINEGDIILSDDWDLTPGRDVIVDTDIIIKRRGMIVEFHHRLLMDVKLNNSGEKNIRRLLAQATITIMAIKGSTYRPTSKLPKWLLDQLGEND